MNGTFELSTLVDRLAGPAGLRLSLALLHFLWQGVLIAAGATVLMRVLGRRSANRRYAIGVAGMALMAIAPVVTFCVVTPPEIAPIESSGASASDELLSEIARIEAMLAALDVRPGEDGATEDPASESILPARPLTWPERVRLWQPYALLVWLAGTGMFALRLGVGVEASRRFGRGRRPLPEAWLKTVVEVAGRVGIKAPRVFVADGAIEAVAVGLLRPMVLIPAAWLGRVPPEVLEAVLAHELAHLRRHDLWVNLLQRCVEAALFYHPAVWWLSRRVRVEREYCCDETAALAVSGRAAYARALEFVAAEAVAVRAAAAARPALRPALAAGMGGESMALLDRVKRVLGADVGPPRGNWMSEGLLALAVPAALWAGIAAVGPAVAQADEADEKATADRRDGEAVREEASRDVLILRDVEEGEGLEEGENADVLVLPADMAWEEAQRLIEERKSEGRDVVIAREPSEDLAELPSERPGVPFLKDIPYLGRLFTMPDGGDVLIAGSESQDTVGEADDDDGGEDDVRAALRELRAELQSLRNEVEQLRGSGDRRIEEKRFRSQAGPMGPPPMSDLPPGKAGELRLEARQHDGFGDMFILRRPNPDGGPARFEVRVLRMDKEGTEPERLIERLHVENADGQPRIFLLRQGQDGKPEKVEGKSDGDETVIRTEEGEIHVRPLREHRRETVVMMEIDGKQVPVVVEEDSDDVFGPKKSVRVRIAKPARPGEDVRPNPGIEPDRKDEVIRKLEQELQRLQQELEKARLGKVEGDREEEMIARKQAEAQRAEIVARLNQLRQQEVLLREQFGDSHPKRVAIRKQIETAEQVLRSAQPDGADVDETQSPDQARQIKVFALKYVTAGQVAGVISHVLAGGKNEPRVSVATDERTNSLIVSAAPESLEEIERLIEQLDSPEAAANGPNALQFNLTDIDQALNAKLPPEAREAIERAMRQKMEAAKAEVDAARRQVEEAMTKAEALRQRAEALTRQDEAAREAAIRAERDRAKSELQKQTEATRAQAEDQARRAEGYAEEARRAFRERAEQDAKRRADAEADKAENRDEQQESEAEPERTSPSADALSAKESAELAEQYRKSLEANRIAQSQAADAPFAEAQIEQLRVEAERARIEAAESQTREAEPPAPNVEEPVSNSEKETAAEHAYSFLFGLLH